MESDLTQGEKKDIISSVILFITNLFPTGDLAGQSRFNFRAAGEIAVPCTCNPL